MMSRIRFSTGGLLSLAAVLPTIALATPVDDAQLACSDIERDSVCTLHWRFPEDRKASYRMQQWDAATAQWLDLAPRHKHASSGYLANPVAAGRLYRVLECSSKKGNCKSSNVIWAPVWISVEEIPDTVSVSLFGRDLTLGVSKTILDGSPQDPDSVITQYNMYLVLQEASAFQNSDAEMPPMLSPVTEGDVPDTLGKTVIYNVQENYADVRSGVAELRGDL